LLHSGWVGGSNSGEVVGVVEVVWTSATGRRRRRRERRKRPAIDEGEESCEDAVMVMTSPQGGAPGCSWRRETRQRCRPLRRRRRRRRRGGGEIDR